MEDASAAATAESDQPGLGADTGAGAVRLAALSRAQHMIDGDLVGHDKFVFHIGGERRPALRRLSPLFHERVQNTFVNPGDWDGLRERFSRRRIALLKGWPGRGRFATAIRLLMTAGAPSIYELDPHVDLDQLVQLLADQGAAAIEPGAGFVLVQTAEPTALRGRTLRDLDEVLRRTDARLVVILGPGTLVADEELVEYVIELGDRPDYRAVLRAHLEWRLNLRGATRWPSEPEIDSVTSQVLGELDSCERAAMLAFVMSEETTDPIDPKRVRERMGRRDLDAFDGWFADLGELPVRSFAIALAALDGLGYDDVARAAERLRVRLDPPADTVLGVTSWERVPDSLRHFRHPRRWLLEQLRARVVEDRIRQPYGWVPAHTVSYKDRSYPYQVLTHVWLEHQVHDVLMDWLADLAGEPSEPVRLQAATTLGLLATLSFHHVLTSVLNGWARSDRLWKREVTAYALRVPAADPRLSTMVRRLVERWLTSGDAKLQATAVRALGLSALDTDPAATIAHIQRAARHAGGPVISAIANTFSDAMESDAARRAPAVLATLLEWFDSSERVNTARLVFLLIAHDLVREAPPAHPAPVRWPGLLHVASQSAQVHERLVMCWRRALSEGSELPMAEDVLDSWARFAERDPAARSAFARLGREVGAADRPREILLRSTRRWRDESAPFPMPQTATALETALNPGRT